MSTQHDHDREHQGTFGEGQAKTAQHPEKRPHGDFAEGQDGPSSEHHHEGTFAEGQARDEHHPEREQHGRFADA
jgi:hypothetical protein